MAAQKFNPERQCQGKNTYFSKAEAKSAIKRLLTHGVDAQRHRGRLRAYRCPHCHRFHIGHTPPKETLT